MNYRNLFFLLIALICKLNYTLKLNVFMYSYFFKTILNLKYIWITIINYLCDMRQVNNLFDVVLCIYYHNAKLYKIVQ